MLWLNQHLYFKAEASTIFEILVKLQLVFCLLLLRSPFLPRLMSPQRQLAETKKDIVKQLLFASLFNPQPCQASKRQWQRQMPCNDKDKDKGSGIYKDHNILIVITDMIFVKTFTQPDFQAQSFTPQKCAICDIFLAN